MIEKNIKFKLIGIGLLGVLVIMLLFLFAIKSSRDLKPRETIKPVVTSSQLRPTRQYIPDDIPDNIKPTQSTLEIDPYSHGARPDAEEIYLKEHPDQLDLEKLRDESPIKTSSFFMEYSFAEVKFLVTIYEPKGENTQAFMDYLESRGLGNSLSNFIIQ